MDYKLHLGNSAKELKKYPDNYFHSVVCDPPYMIDFLGKEWDSQLSDLTLVFKECLRVLKPGGYLLAFSATRTYHKTATMVEEAGFDIKDMISWIYTSGFPKGGNTAKKIDKMLGNKDLQNDVKEEDLILQDDDLYCHNTTNKLYRKLPNVKGDRLNKQTEFGESYGYCFEPIYEATSEEGKAWDDWSPTLKPASEPIVLARKPSKLSTAANCLEHRVGAMNIGACRIQHEDDDSRWPSNIIGEIHGYQKFFYCPKVSSAERNEYMENEVKPFSGVSASQGTDMLDVRKALNNETEGRWNSGGEWKTVKKQGNTHPTVKPIDLMRYLCRLVTPKGGIVLDPFMGSGSTGMAAAREGFDFVGIEMDETYYNIADKRVSIEYDAPSNNIFGEKEE